MEQKQIKLILKDVLTEIDVYLAGLSQMSKDFDDIEFTLNDRKFSIQFDFKLSDRHEYLSWKMIPQQKRFRLVYEDAIDNNSPGKAISECPIDVRLKVHPRLPEFLEALKNDIMGKSSKMDKMPVENRNESVHPLVVAMGDDEMIMF